MTARRILYLAHRTPYPPDKGDRIRTFHNIEFLCQRGHEIFLAALADERVEPEHVAALELLCEEVGIVPLSKKRWLNAMACAIRGRTATEGVFSSRRMRLLLQTWTADTQFDVVIASGSGMHSYFDLPGLRSLPVLVDLIDVDSQKWFDYAAQEYGPKRLLYQVEGQRLRKLEEKLSDRARALVVVSEAEARLIDSPKMRVIGNGVDLEYFRSASPSCDPICAFVGALNYRPNVDGIVWFCNEVWAGIAANRPEARLFIIGRKPVAAVDNLRKCPGVEIIGQVDDIRPYLDRAAVVVVPLQIARGVQNKVLEAFAMNRAVVASPEALRALNVQDERELLIANNRDEWIAKVTRLLAENETRTRLGTAARAYVEAHHSWSKCLEPWEDLLRDL